MVQEDLKAELQTLRETHMELLRSDAEQISAVERSVCENGLILERVRMENSRLHLVGQLLMSVWFWISGGESD